MPVITTCGNANTELVDGSVLDHRKAEPKRGSAHYDFLEKYFDTSRLTSQVEAQSVRAMNQTMKRQSLLAELTAVMPDQLDRLSAWLANSLDISYFIGETGAANLRRNLLASKTTAENVLNVLGRAAENQKLNKALKSARRIARRHGFKTDSAFSQLFREVIEVGQIPLRTKATATGDVLSNVFSPHTVEHAFLGKLFNEFTEKLKKSGFTDVEVKELLTLGAEYSNVQKVIRESARKFGVDVGDLQGGTGYFSRIMTPQARQYFLKLRQSDLPDIDVLTGDRAQLSSSFAKLRSTTIPLPKEAWDVTVTSILNYDRSLVEAGLSKLDGYDARSLSDHLSNLLMNDPGKYVKFLQDNVNPKVIDALVNEGVLQQTAMTSSIVADYWAELYRLPNGVKMDLFEVDPNRVMQEYANDLGRAAGAHEMFTHISNQGVEQGWAIPNDLFQEYKRTGEFPDGLSASDFVNLKNTELWKRANVDTKHLPLGNNWLYRPAAEVFVGLIKMQSSPAQLSNFMGGVSRFFQLQSTSILLAQNTKYLFRVLAGNGASALGATGYNPMALVATMSRNLQVTMAMGRAKSIDKVFDDVQKIAAFGGKEYTAKELFEGIYALRNTDGIPLTALQDQASFTSGASLLRYYRDIFASPMDVAKRTFEYATWSADPDKVRRAFSFGTAKDALEYLFGQSYRQAIEKLFAPLAYAANISDLGTRMAILELLPKNRFNSLEEALRYTDQYIPRPDSAGQYTRVASRYFAPFTRYMMFSMGSSMRHAYRYPNRYMAINKAVSFFNDDRTMTGGCQTAQAGVEPWMRDQYGIVLGCRSGEAGQNDPVVLYSNNFDPLIDGTTRVTGTIETFGRMLGITDASRYPEDFTGREPDALADFTSDVVGTSYYAGLVETLTNTSLLTGGELQQREIAGVRVSGRVFAMTQAVFPFLREIVDRTGLEAPVQRTDALGRTVYESRAARPMPELTHLGLNVRQHQTARQLQSSVAAIKSDREAVGRAIGDLHKERNELARIGKPFDHIDQQIRKLAEAEYIMFVDEARIRQYAAQRGVPLREALRAVNEAYELMGEAATHQLPNPQVEAYTEAYEKYQQRYQELNDE